MILFAIEGPVSSTPLPDSQHEFHETGGSPAYPTNNTCGLSITFGSPPETEKNGNQVKASGNLNPPVSEFLNREVTNTSTTAYDPKGNDALKDDRSLTSEVNPVANLSKKDIADFTTKGKDVVGKRQLVPVTAANKASMVILVAVHNPCLKPLFYLSECYSLYCLYF